MHKAVPQSAPQTFLGMDPGKMEMTGGRHTVTRLAWLHPTLGASIYSWMFMDVLVGSSKPGGAHAAAGPPAIGPASVAALPAPSRLPRQRGA